MANQSISVLMVETRDAIVSKGGWRAASSEVKKPPEPSIFLRLKAQFLLSLVASEFVSEETNSLWLS